MSSPKKQPSAKPQAAPRQSKKMLFLLRGDKITDDLLEKVVDDLIAATAVGQADVEQNNHAK